MSSARTTSSRDLGPCRLHGRNLSRHGKQLSLPDLGRRNSEGVHCRFCILSFCDDEHDLDYHDSYGAIARIVARSAATLVVAGRDLS